MTDIVVRDSAPLTLFPTERPPDQTILKIGMASIDLEGQRIPRGNEVLVLQRVRIDVVAQADSYGTDGEVKNTQHMHAGSVVHSVVLTPEQAQRILEQ